jgi:hypothetical protein
MQGVASRIFVGLVFLTVEPGPKEVYGGRRHDPLCSLLNLTELYQPAARESARDRSFLSWHGMPTASVKSKHFLN